MGNDNRMTLCYTRNIDKTVLWTLLGLDLVKILMDYVRENCNNVSELSGKCQGISSGVVCGNPEIGIFTDIIFKFITFEATCKF